MTSPAPTRAQPTTFVMVALAVAVVVSIAGAVWFLAPSPAPRHPYDAALAHRGPVPQSRSYELGPVPDDPASSGSPAPSPSVSSPPDVAAPPATPSPGLDPAQQAAVAAAALAGSDAAQITADGYEVAADVSTDASDAGPPASGPASAGVSTPASLGRYATTPPTLLSRAPAADLLGNATGTTGTTASDGTAALKATALSQMLAHGFGAEQWTCLDNVITRESGWHVTATNIRSGAYGLPQALPATKMATAGADWQVNPRTQLAWMLDYVQRRYHDPCGAWAHEVSDGWY